MAFEFENTLNGALELKASLCCESCKKYSDEPYFTGVCDHLLCKECVSKSNSCLVCDAAYYKKEIKLSFSLKEAILYVNKIISVINDEDDNQSESCVPEVLVKNDDIPSSIVEIPAPEPTQSLPMNIQRRPSKKIPKASQSVLKSVPENIQKVEDLTNSQIVRAKKSKKNEKGETPLHIAAMNGDIEACTQLVFEMQDLNITDNAGWTPLHEACVNGHLEIVRLLIDNNACVNFKGYLDSTPLHEAVLNEKIDCVKYLLEHGAETTLRNAHGFYPKDFAKTSEMIRLLNDTELQTKILNQSVITATHTDSIESTISPARKTRKSTLRKQKKVIIYSTGMTSDEKVRLNELVNKLDIKITQEMNTSVTHVVSKDGAVCQRTINYMKAVLMGKWIVSVKWLEDSLTAGYLLEENQYEFQGSHKIGDSKASYKGRMNACVQNPNLFEGCSFYFHGEFKVFAKVDLVKLVQLAGAKILKREPKLERLEELMQPAPFHVDNNLKCSHFIVYDENKPNRIIRHEYLNTMNINWVFNCIDKFKIYLD